MKKPIPYTWLFGGAVAAIAVLASVAHLRPDPAAIASPTAASPVAPAEAAPAPKLPSFADLLETTAFAPLKSSKLSTVAITDPPAPPPLATVAAAEATAPKSLDPCEVAVRKLARTTAAPIRETILDDIEAKYELIRVNANQRFSAIRSACVKVRDHPKRG